MAKKIDWVNARVDFELGGLCFKELAEKYSCHVSTVRRKVRKQGWRKKVEPEKSKGKTCRCKVRRGKGRAAEEKKGDEQVGNKGVNVKGKCSAIASPDKSVLHGHRKLWGNVKKKLTDGLHSDDEKQLKLAKIAGDGLLNIVKGERQAWGLSDIDDIDTGPEEILGITKEMDEVTSPHGAAKAVEGR